MMDWTDRHCRYFHRLLAPHALLYTEMVTADALLHGDLGRHLDFDAAEHPLALQLGGSDPADLAHCARLAEKWGYDEVNLNCGCPSERVQRGSFGACLMAEPELVGDCVSAMQDATRLPVTVKHRIGIDRVEDYGFVANFVDTLARRGCVTFIVHARNAWLHGLSPKENREVPPLRYDYVERLKQEFPELEFILNGGLTTQPQIDAALATLDGVMIGREAYHNPYTLALLDAHLLGDGVVRVTRAEVAQAMVDYARRYLARPGAHAPHLRHVTRHILGLYQGRPGAKRWRRVLSDTEALKADDVGLVHAALEEVEQAHSLARM
jgi:tRNA-dihydrouridine synthase A